MDRRTFLKAVPTFTVLAAAGSAVSEVAAGEAQAPAELKTIELLKPEKDGGKSVMAALWERRTNRNISPKPLEPQVLSNLLWAAWGVNRPAGPFGQNGRTAASASNSQEIDLYVVLSEGVYLYDGAAHRLLPVVAGDQRGKVGRGQRGAMATAPVNLIFVADIAKYAKARLQELGLRDVEIQKSYSNIAAGLIAANVYLFAASQGLGAWFHNCNKTALTDTLKLRLDQRVLYAQTVGYPA